MSQSGVLDVINSSPTIPTTFDTDSGSAIPVANVLDILGTQGITTSGAGKAVTVTGVLATAGATVGASTIGVAAFDSTSFTVTAGFVQLSGAGLAIDEILLDSGAQIPPTGAGLIKFNGNTAAAGSTPVQTLSTEANQFQLDVQRAATSVGTDDTAQGLASFDSTVFTVDANGYVTITGPLPVASGGTGAATLTGVLTGNGTSAITANAVTEYGVLIGGASNAVASTAVGTATYVLTSNGPGVAPTYQANGNGNVAGPASATDNAIARYDGATGKIIQNSTVLVNDDGDLLCSGDRAEDIGSTTNAWDNIYCDGISFDDGSNFLDDYEEGTFTPTIGGSSGGSGQTYAGQAGWYTKIGDLVVGKVNITTTGIGTLTGVARFEGLPFTVADGAKQWIDSNGTYSAGTALGWEGTGSATHGDIQSCGTGTRANQTITTLGACTTNTNMIYNV